MKDILSIKFRLELVYERVLWGGLVKKWRGTRKTILEAILPSCLLVTNTPLFTKSLLESLIMLFKPPNSSTPSRRTLKEAGLCSATKKKVPMLKASHQQRRLKFARDHENWTVEDWKRVLWSDETKINRIGSDGKVYVWKKRGESISDRTTTPTVKHGGVNNLMVWGCMGWNGVGKLIEVEEKMDAQQYCEILEDGLVESFEELDIEEGQRYFQQDNDPKHTSRLATTWFSDNNIIVIHWPAQSPDLNPIEHLWYHAKCKLQEYEIPPKGVHELWDILAKEWNEIPSEVCQRLIESMPRRIGAVIKANGGHTKC